MSTTPHNGIDPVVQAPFPWFGGKSRVAPLIWRAFGHVANYVEPFFGSGAVLLSRPHALTWEHVERVNDADGFICNFYRAVAYDPDAVAEAATWPTNECDLHARHAYLTALRGELTSRLEGDPHYFDTHIAGWWLWAINLWIGGGFTSGKGPWAVADGRLIQSDLGNKGQGINRQRPHLSNKGQGINRQRPHLGDKGRGINRKRPHLGDKGQGINRQLPHLGSKGENIRDYMRSLHERMSRVDVVCGDWLRVCGNSLTVNHGLTGVFLDPPYDMAIRDSRVYTEDTHALSQDVREWAISQGDHPQMRIALCGYEGEHPMPQAWRKVEWKTRGGYGNQGEGQARDNASLERIWLSPHCLPVDIDRPEQIEMW